MAQPQPSWKQPRFLADLTPHMSQALVRCHTQPVLVADKGHKDAGIATVTLNVLVARGLVDEQRDKRARPVWKPTALGLRIIRAEQPRFLSRAADHMDPGTVAPGYTVDPAKAMFPDAGEAVDSVTQQRISREARERDLALADGVDGELFAALAVLRAQRQELARVAQARGLDLRSQVRLIDRAQNSLEQQIRQQRDGARSAA